MAKGQSTAEAEQSTILDDTLKCAFCFELCVRPVTVRMCDVTQMMHRLMQTMGRS